MRVLIVAPVGSPMHLGIERDIAQRSVGRDVEVSVRHLEGLPDSIYVPPEEIFIPRLIDAVRQAELEGFDAVGISCCSDPGIRECRAAVSIPVCAPFDAVTEHYGADGGIGILYLEVEAAEGESELRGEDWIPELLATYGREDAVRVALPVAADRPSIAADEDAGAGEATPEQVGEALFASMSNAMNGPGIAQAATAESLGARVLFPTCTYWAGTLDDVRRAVNVPVLDPIAELARCLERHATEHRARLRSTPDQTLVSASERQPE